MDYGEWEGLTYEQIEQRDAAFRAAWEKNPETLPCPGGESGKDVAERIRAWLAELLGASDDAGARSRDAASEAGRTVLAVGHSSTNRILLSVALQAPVANYRRTFRQDPTNLTVLRFPGSDIAGQLLLGNDLSHIRGTRGATWG